MDFLFGGENRRNGGKIIYGSSGTDRRRRVSAAVCAKICGPSSGLYKMLLGGVDNFAGDFDLEKKIEIGMDGIERIGKSYLVCADIALKTAELILVSEKEDARLQSCYMAAFESDTNAINYLRVFLNSKDQESCKKLLEDAFQQYKGKDKDKDTSFYGSHASGYTGENRSELAINEPSKNMIYILRMLNGEFIDVLRKGVSAKAALGWTGTFMKDGIEFFLLYLFGGKSIPQGIARMIGMTKRAFGFTFEQYAKGQTLEHGGDDDLLFYDCFLRWKDTAVSDDSDKKKMLEKRVDGIMDANRRNYYGECAAFIAAVGEVKESYGKAGEKQRYMESYKNKYSKRSAFRAELEHYGWIRCR
jgi:hypothetical protein